MKALLVLAVLSIFTTSTVSSRQPDPSVDVQHYVFKLQLAEEHDTLKAVATVRVLLKQEVDAIGLDLVKASNGAGMQVTQLLVNGRQASFSHQDDKLRVLHKGKANEAVDVQITYQGIPADGLIIGKNKFGDKTFFGDNWPNRARHWLPVVDHPADKATCEFIVLAPLPYKVVANGALKEESLLQHQTKLTHWIESMPIPTKVMVMGAARFALEHVAEVNDVPVQTWVFPQNRQAGFYDYAPAAPILDTLEALIGPYPFEKLANVQSKTRYGGMENAGNIFYFENSVTGQRKIESLIAHEIAHQWFGNSASEKDWHHVWLSEGFATYFTQLYRERAYGSDSLRMGMKRMIPEIKEYYLEKPSSPIVDTSIVELIKLLNTNSYQKGSWVLHMLRKEVGDEAFFAGVRTYYKTYAYSNALTEDFKVIMEAESGKELDDFFRQWLFEPLFPQIRLNWHYDNRKKKLVLAAQSNLTDAQTISLEIGLTDADGTITEIKKIELKGKSTQAEWDVASKPAGILADPHVWLLADLNINSN